MVEKQKETRVIEPAPADATSVYTPPQASALDIGKTKEALINNYRKLKKGDDVTVVDNFGSFTGKVVQRDEKNKAVYIEASLTKEWRNFWKARPHRPPIAPAAPIPLAVYNTVLTQLTDLDPIGFYDWLNRQVYKKYFSDWFSRIEIRRTLEGAVLRYVLYEDDVSKGYTKEINVGSAERLTQEEMAEALGVKPSPYSPYSKPAVSAEELKVEKEPSALGYVKGSATTKPAVSAEETKVEEKETIPKPAKVAKPTKKLPDIELSPEIMALGPKGLLDLITLDYGLQGVYKGKNWIGGAHGLVYDEQVAILQQLYNTLVEKGIVSGSTIKVDGKYSDETRAAVMRMQRTVGVTVDGFFGIDTKNGIYGLLGLTPEEEGGEEKEEEREKKDEEKLPKEEAATEAVGQVLTLTREIDTKYVKPPKGVTQLMDEHFYINTDAGWLSAKDAVKKDLKTIDKNWETDKETAASRAGRENWKTTTLTRKNIGVFSWANTKKVLFPYLMASEQEFEFRTWEPLFAENGAKIEAGKIIRGTITEYDERTGEFKVKISAVQDEFTVKGGKPTAPESVGAAAPAETVEPGKAPPAAGASQTTAQMAMGSRTLAAYDEALKMVNADFEKSGTLRPETINVLKKIGFLGPDGNIAPEMQANLLDENIEEVVGRLPPGIESDVFTYSMTRDQIAKLNQACYTNKFDEVAKVFLTESLLFLGIYLAAVNREIASLPSDFKGYA